MHFKRTTLTIIIFFLISLLSIIYYNYTQFEVMLFQTIIIVLTYTLVKYWGNLLTYIENKINLFTIVLSFSFISKYLINSFILLVLCNLIGYNIPYNLNLFFHLDFLSLTFLSGSILQISLIFSYSGYGDRSFNCLLALCISIFLTILLYNLILTLSIGMLIWITIISGILFICNLLRILQSDLFSIYYPCSGIGIFFGTFNPIHKSHIKIIKEAISQRNLEKVLIQPTVIPKLHSQALAKGEILISEHKNGVITYTKTNKADNNVNYFPTGNKFYEYKIRKYLIKQALYDEGLLKYVTILDLPEIYQSTGFLGIINYIKQKYPNKHLHGIHGTDTGGIWVRYLFIRAGSIFPFPVLRKDGISSTRIRSGDRNLTTKGVQKIIDILNQGVNFKKLP